VEPVIAVINISTARLGLCRAGTGLEELGTGSRGGGDESLSELILSL
jgi:hydrogenase maturation factor HypE